MPIGPGPVRNLICDDPGLVKPTVRRGHPVALEASASGPPCCSVTDALSVRRTYRVDVAAPAPGRASRGAWPTGSESVAPSTSRTGRAPHSAEASDLARRFGAVLVLLHAEEMPGVTDIPPPESVVEATRRELAARLAEWRAEAAAALGRPVEAPHVPGPRGAGAGPGGAARTRLDLLVTGTHGRRGFRHLVLGSVAERLVHLAPCAVLVVRA